MDFTDIADLVGSIAPALAAIGAERKGQLGSFMHGSQVSEEMRQRAEANRLAQQYRQDRLAQYDEGLLRQRQALEYRQQQDEIAAAAEKEGRLQTTLRNAIAPLATNPMYADGVTEEEARGFVIPVPGIGNVSLKDAFEKLGFARDASGTYFPFAPLKPAKEDLVAVPGPDGKPVYGPKVKGAPVYERPRVPREPASSKPDAFNIVDQDPESPTYGKTFRVTADRNGRILSKTPIDLGTTDAPAPPTAGDVPPAHAKTPYRVGDIVTVKGQQVRVTKLNPDGSYEGEPVR